jgi:hypothetical protein
MVTFSVMPVKTGIQRDLKKYFILALLFILSMSFSYFWIPAFAGMTAKETLRHDAMIIPLHRYIGIAGLEKNAGQARVRAS